jgi:hypothetical protein
LNTFFDVRKDIEEHLVKAKQAGLQQFKDHSSEEFNQDGSLAMQIFEIALSLVPGAGALAKGFKGVAGAGQKTVKLAEELEKTADAVSRLEKVEKVTEGIGKVVDVPKKIGEAIEKHEKPEETGSRLTFESRAISSLTELDAGNTAARYADKFKAVDFLKTLEHAPANIDLEARISDALGPVPKDQVARLPQMAKEASDQFELGMYKAFYLDTEKAVHLFLKTGFGGVVTGLDDRGIVGLPARVKERFEDPELKAEWMLAVYAHQKVQTWQEALEAKRGM